MNNIRIEYIVQTEDLQNPTSLLTVENLPVLPVVGDLFLDTRTMTAYRVVQRVHMFKEQKVVLLNQKQPTVELLYQITLVEEGRLGAN